MEGDWCNDIVVKTYRLKSFPKLHEAIQFARLVNEGVESGKKRVEVLVERFLLEEKGISLWNHQRAFLKNVEKWQRSEEPSMKLSPQIVRVIYILTWTSQKT